WSAAATRVEADQGPILVTLVSHSDAPTRGTVAAFGHRRGGTRAPRSRELLAFARVHLRPGEQQRLELLCPAGRFFADPADPASRTDLDVEGRLCVVAPSPTSSGDCSAWPAPSARRAAPSLSVPRP